MLTSLETMIRHRRFPDLLLAGIFVLAGAAQAGLWAAGLYSVSADESARALMAHDLTWKTALDPYIWPPFYKIAVSMGLWLHDDLFVTPRAMAFVLGLILLGALCLLAHRLFGDRRVTIVTAALGVFLSHRVVFGAAPQSEMFFNVFMLMAFAYTAGWLREGRTRDVLLASAFLVLASLVRFEAWFVSMVFGLGLAYMHFFEKRLTFGTLALAGVIVSSAPLTVLGAAFTYHGSLDPLLLTGVQAEMFGTTKSMLITWSHGYMFAHDFLLSPLILAAVPLVAACLQPGPLRRFVLFLAVTLALVTIVAIGTGSVSYAAHWRLSGVWTLALVPFLAMWIVELAASYAPQPEQLRLRAALLTGAVFLCMAGFALGTMDIVQRYNDEFSREERQVGRFLRQALAETPGKVLLEPTDFNFLDIIVSANAPGRTVLSTAGGWLHVGLYVGYDDYWRKKDPAIYKAYLEPQYALERGGDAAKFAANDIAFVVTQNLEHGGTLEASGLASKAAEYGPWAIYRVTR